MWPEYNYMLKGFTNNLQCNLPTKAGLEPKLRKPKFPCTMSQLTPETGTQELLNWWSNLLQWHSSMQHRSTLFDSWHGSNWGNLNHVQLQRGTIRISSFSADFKWLWALQLFWGQSSLHNVKSFPDVYFIEIITSSAFKEDLNSESAEEGTAGAGRNCNRQ